MERTRLGSIIAIGTVAASFLAAGLLSLLIFNPGLFADDPDPDRPIQGRDGVGAVVGNGAPATPGSPSHPGSEHVISGDGSGETWFQRGLHYYESRMYDDAIRQFGEAEIRGSGSVREKAGIYNAMALIKRGLDSRNHDDLSAARTQLEHVLDSYADVAGRHSREFSRLLLAMASLERALNAYNFELIPQMEDRLIYLRGDERNEMLAELGFQYLNNCETDRAVGYFQQSSSSLAKYGLILAYKRTGCYARAKAHCQDFLNYHKSDPMYATAVCACSCNMPARWRVRGLNCGDFPNVNCSSETTTCGGSAGSATASTCGTTTSSSCTGNCGRRQGTAPARQPAATSRPTQTGKPGVNAVPVDIVPVNGEHGMFRIVTGSYEDRANADTQAGQISRLGIPSRVQPVISRYQVVSTAYYSREDAENLVKRVQEAGIGDAYVVASNGRQ